MTYQQRKIAATDANTEGKSMSEVLLAVFAGVLVGFVFSAIKLPLPAPPVISGIMGIVGIYIGGQAYQLVVEKFFS